ncbi:TPA: tRNA (guanosine(37)-N1)-methyltransferase TrmD [Candidatus Uhrbacteria bacterium]|nr:tRNA (guanosine(37)-N1)-methyltransferase TrmD [Candidatus Uhrbacteria bacterium]HCB19014.1 tRNA (guanosine(37)-N1)-methyltransferase TrmD [Candidatus Uhrbacteria bacterium]
MATRKQKYFDILTIFPEALIPYAEASILGRAQTKKILTITAHDVRTWATDKHHTTDDTPYGGGPGMVMKVEPFDRAIKATKKRGKKVQIILTAASGKTFTQADAKRLASYDQLIFLCGRYEGVDDRVREHLVDETFSIGNYVLTGGELPALVMIDAIARMIPGVLGKKESLTEESHVEEGLLEYPQYTKPEIYRHWKVPPILLSGDHKKIKEWRKEQQKKK